MSMNINAAVARISREVPNAEASLDDALMSLSSLLMSMVQARKETGVAPSTGQSTITRLAKAQLTLVSVSSDVLRVHSDLAHLAQTHAGLDLHEHCTDGHLSSESTARIAVAG